MDALLVRRRNLKAKLTRTKNKVDAHTVQPLDIDDAEILEEQLVEIWTEINELTEDIMNNCAADEQDIHEEAFNVITDRYYEVKVTLRRIVRALNSNSNSDGGTSGDATRGRGTTVASVKLPKLDLPTFSGELLEWPQFRDLFKSSVHDQPIAGALKLKYLMTTLEGAAAQLIEKYPITDANYIEAWNVLEKRYQNERELVRVLISKFNKQNYLKEKSATGLRSLVDTSTSCILGLKAQGRVVSVDDANDWVTFGIMERLDGETRELWEAKLGRNVMPKLSELLEFLDDRVSYLSSSCSEKLKDEKTMFKATFGKKQVLAHQTTTAMKCANCDSESHMAYNCPEFLKLTVEKRREKVKEKNLCFNCLKNGHAAVNCPTKSKCKTCKKGHNTLLHIEYSTDALKKVSQSDMVTAHMSNNNGIQKRALLATAMVSILDNSGDEHQFRVFLDPGADVSFITENAVQLLGLKKQKTEVTISGLASNPVGSSKSMVQFILKSTVDAEFCLEAEAYVMNTITGLLPKKPLKQVEKDAFKHIQLADPGFAVPGRVDLLLGSDVYFEIIREGPIVKCSGLPNAMPTVWGYIIGGKCPSQVMSHKISVHHVVSNDELNATLKTFWEAEECPRKTFYTIEEQLCEDHFETSHSRNDEGRYVVRLPFREEVPSLGASVHLAEKRLKMMEKQLSSQPHRKEQYISFMREYLKLGHMELIPQDEVASVEGAHYYLPHHPVIKDESTSTKLRVVFDASAKTTSKISLNDRLMTGPKLQDDLFAILVRFRLHNVALKADICKMYRQILVDRRDCDYQRILWRESPEEPIKHYRLLTVTYGTSVAPFLAKRCLQQLTDDEKLKLPRACDTAASDFYMDDLMSGEASEAEAVKMYKEVFELLTKGGMELRKWTSNSVSLLQNVPAELRETQIPFKIDETDSVKTLGIVWIPSSDHFKFKVMLSTQIASSKRMVSSVISKIFDPLGWITPVTVRAKMLLQDIWRINVEWDQQLPYEIQSIWNTYHQSLMDLENINIPRCIYDVEIEDYDLYAFSDASQRAFAAVIYIATTNEDGTRSVNMLAAKCKAAPIKQVTLPRLELCGAVLLVRLLEAVMEAIHKKPKKVYAWTDSTIVLEWLKGHPSEWETFVANRVSEVQKVLPSDYWRHVSGSENPADCATRGITPHELKYHSLWWHGPQWLQRNPENYQSNYEAKMEVVRAEQKKTVSINYTVTESDFSLLHRYSSLPKILRVTALCFRFSYNTKRKSKDRNLQPLKFAEVQNAMRVWVKIVQNAIFNEEIQNLMKKCPMSAKSRISSLNPYLDEHGVLRVGGRLKNAKIDFQKKFPILLPKKHRFTELLIAYEHMINLHADSQLLLATLQRKYWIVGARDIIRYWVKKCVICSRHRADMMEQFMGDLPSTRVNPGRPFLKSGVDYAGPMTLRIRKGKGGFKKGYIAIFVCFVTRALHLELVSNLSTQGFIAAFRRFTGRRGKCQDLYSDCGRTFVGAQKELKFLQSKMYNEQLANVLVSEQVNFHFNPPGAPHFGGLWEAGIKSVKYHLRRTIGNLILNDEEMLTLLIQIEACLNSRPISPMSNDPTDLQPLTPGHFLIGDALTALPDANYVQDGTSSLTRWQLVQRTFQDFWRRWSKEYLTRLQQRPKWCGKRSNIQLGDMVIIKDDRYPPLKWKLGRVIKVHQGGDGLIRVVTLRTAEGEITRPIVKLSLLPIENV